MEYYFETDDDLERYKYASFLRTMIVNSDNYRREDSKGAYVIAIDSPWGTGKTRFSKMFCNSFVKKTNNRLVNSHDFEESIISAVYYNSWDTDFSSNALEPLIYSILESPTFFIDKNERYGQEIFDDLWTIAGKILKLTGVAVTRKYLGNSVAESISEIFTESAKKKNPLEEYKTKLDLLDSFQEKLQEIINYKKLNKLIIVVDELDRCRPTFAIQTLEIAKHLFEIDKVVFVFALDIKQLSCAIKCVYGQEIDAQGYLCRFFDYIGQFPIASTRNMISSKLKQIKNYRDFETRFQERIIEAFEIITSELELTFREISTLIRYFWIMCDNFLQNYQNIEAYILYLAFIALKYKHLALYRELFVKKNTEALQDRCIGYNLFVKLNILEIVKKIVDNKQISDLVLPIHFSSEWDSKSEPISIYRVNVDDDQKTKKRRVSISYSKFSKYKQHDVPTVSISIGNNISWGHVLFYYDLLMWNGIKNISLSTFYYQQLEMVDYKNN